MADQHMNPMGEAAVPLEHQGQVVFKEMNLDHASHHLIRNDPKNPLNWPLHRKLYASAVSWFFAFAV
jgi:hypothetical protein